MVRFFIGFVYIFIMNINKKISHFTVYIDSYCGWNYLKFYMVSDLTWPTSFKINAILFILHYKSGFPSTCQNTEFQPPPQTWSTRLSQLEVTSPSSHTRLGSRKIHLRWSIPTSTIYSTKSSSCTDLPTENPAFRNWIRVDQLLLCWLLTTIGIRQVNHASSSVELWTILVNLFMQTSLVKVLQLKQQLAIL